MKIYAVSSVNESSGAPGPQARLGFYINESCRLAAEVSPQARQGELMVLWDNGCRGGGSAGALAGQAVREAVRRGFSGIAADFEGERNSFLSDLLSAMEGQLSSRGMSLYVPEHFAGAVTRAKVMVSTAVSGGSLKQRLAEAAERHGPGRVAAEIQRVRERFSLPAKNGAGEPLTGAQLRRIREKYRPACFFSAPLCAYYFTYRAEDAKTRFVLFDDAVSMARKLETARALGITDAFLLYAENEDIYPDILRRLEP